MNPFYQALDSGYSAEEILKYLSKAIPKMAEPIKKANRAGYTVQQILGYLSKTFDTEDRRGMSETERHAANRRADAAMTKYGLKIAATAVSAPIASHALSTALSRALPNSVQQLVPGIASASPQPNLPPNASGISSSEGMSEFPQKSLHKERSSQQPPINAPNIPQVPEPVQPELKTINPVDILNKHKSKEKVDEILKAGNKPEAVAAFLKKFSAKIANDIEKEARKPLEELIAEYASNSPKPALNAEKQPENAEIPQVQEKISPKEEKAPIEKNAIVSTPNGVGEIKEVRGGQALVDIDGKLHKVKEEELEAEPEDIANLYDNLFNAIPDQYKSRMMNFAGYDEEANELLFRPHGGAAYVYKNIPPQFAEDLKNRLHRAKTTGGNMYGMWYQGDQSYGAGMSALIKQLQQHYGGKGKEYIRKYNTLFDILGIPHEAKKRREQEERKRRKGNG